MEASFLIVDQLEVDFRSIVIFSDSYSMYRLSAFTGGVHSNYSGQDQVRNLKCQSTSSTHIE